MRKIKLDKRGLSPLVAVIVLLTLVMVLGAIIAGTLSGAPRPVLPATTAVNLAAPLGGNPAAGDDVLIIRHEYGQVIDDAWSTDDGESVTWEKMVMLINGERADAKLHDVVIGAKATLTTGTPDQNNVIHYEAVEMGSEGNRIYIQYFATYANHALTVSVYQSGTMMRIDVHVATDADHNSTSTANDVAAAVNADPDASALVTATAEDGGLVFQTLPGPQNFLSGGVNQDYLPGTYDFAIGDQIVIDIPTLQSSDLIQLVWEPRDLMLVEYLVQ